MIIKLLPKRGIVNKGFSGLQGAVVRLKVGCSLLGKKPANPYKPYRQTVVGNCSSSTYIK